MSRQKALPSNLPPRGLSREQAAEFCGMGPDLFDRQVQAGKLPLGIKFGGRVVWDRAALEYAFDRLSGISEPEGERSLAKAAIMGRIRGKP